MNEKLKGLLILFMLAVLGISLYLFTSTIAIIQLTEDIKTEPTPPTNQTTKCTGEINITGNCGVDDYLTYRYITTGSLTP